MRLIIVSNRLPVTIDDVPGSGHKRSIGGLATGIDSYIKRIKLAQTDFDEYLWFGWPGASIKKEKREAITEECIARYSYHPVYLSKKLIEGFYQDYCNKVLWPLFHCFPDRITCDTNSWKYYQEANEIFYLELKDKIKDGDVIWIHDYQLMLLPQMIRKDFPNAVVTFFMHIPFPPINLFNHLPKMEQEGLLNGLLGADVIGFHTQDYTQDFKRCVSKVLQIDCSQQTIRKAQRKIKVDVFPMGIDYQEIKKTAKSEACTLIKAQVRKDLPACKIILSVDRLDYTKGILNRLIAFNKFLELHPELTGKVVLMLIVAPSRGQIESYKQMKRNIDEWVGRINGTYGTHTWCPVIYQYRQYSFLELCALYGISDVALITPFCDGMNLIAKEYIASNETDRGVLILSEMAGAIHELSEALAVNPFCPDELVSALTTALAMPAEEINRRNKKMHLRLRSYDVLKWADTIFTTTSKTVENRYGNEKKVLNAMIRKAKIDQYRWADSEPVLAVL